ncbi:uncharacterized protein V6R79_004699 [Siganus canaliculatus]
MKLDGGSSERRTSVSLRRRDATAAADVIHAVVTSISPEREVRAKPLGAGGRRGSTSAETIGFFIVCIL